MTQLNAEQAAGLLAAAATAMALPLAEAHGAAADMVAAELTRRLDAMVAEARHAALPAALREAQLQALQVTLSTCGAGPSPPAAGGQGSAAPADDFHKVVVAWSATALAGLAKARGAHGVRRIRRPTVAQGAANPTLTQRRLAAEEQLLAEIDVMLGPRRLPETFLACFLDQRPERAGWFDAFSVYLAWHLRSDPGLVAGLAAEPLAELAKLDTTLDEMLEALFARARDLAQRLEAHLAEAEAHSSAETGTETAEVARFLDRLPRDIAARHRLPSEPLIAAAAALVADGREWCHIEERLEEQARCLAGLLDDLTAIAQGKFESAAAAAVAAASRALVAVRQGDLVAAGEALLRAGGDLGPQRAAVAALAGDWPAAKAALNAAIAQAGVRRRDRSLAAARELTRVLAMSSGAPDQKAAAEVCQTLLSHEGGQGDALGRAEILVRLSQTAARMTKGAGRLRALAAAAQAHARFAAVERARLPAVWQARLCAAAGDVALMLAVHGAQDRLGEAATAYGEAVRCAEETRDPRLASEMQARFVDLLLHSARGAPKDDARRLRSEALAALHAAQVPRLRWRDPIWWAFLKLRIAEASLGAADGREDAAATLRAAVVAAKAAVRILPVRQLTERHARGLVLLADAYAALAKAEGEPRWRVHALASCEEALSVLDAARHPALCVAINEQAATLALAQADAITTDDLQATIARLRAALSIAGTGQPMRRARLDRLLGEALAIAGRKRIDLPLLQEAGDAYRRALQTLTLKSAPGLWCQSLAGLAAVARQRARLEAAAGVLGPIIDELERARRAAEGIEPAWVSAALGREVRACREVLRKQGGEGGTAAQVARAPRALKAG